MERLEILERLAALTSDLTPARGVRKAQLAELRRFLARELQQTRAEGALGVPRRTAEPLVAAPERLDWSSVGPEIRDQLERLLDLPPSPAEQLEAGEELPSGVRVARRTVPFHSSVEVGSVPDWAGGRAIDRTLGPFRDRDGRLLWFDIFLPMQQVALVRAPSSAPFLLLPFRGFFLGASTEYALPAGSIWILSRALASTAPAGGYSGIRIKRGRLRLSSAPAVSGLTLTIPAGTRVTLELELDPPASTAPAAEPGKDALAATVKLPERATFLFTAAGGLLQSADDAKLKAFGAGFSLHRDSAPAAYEPAINRVLLPFALEPGELAIANSQSRLCTVAGTAPVTLGAWALPVAVAPPSELGNASGAGALALVTGDGLRADWRGRQGPPVDLGPAIVLAETDRLAVLAEEAKGAGSRQTLRLWETGSPHAEVRLRLDRPRLRYESLAGRLDALLVTGGLEAATDRPVPVNGRRFSLRSDESVAVFWDDPTTSHVLVQALLLPPEGIDVTALALHNALITVSPPWVLLLYGQRAGGDDEQLQSGTLTLLFRVLRFVFTLPDPYVTNQPMLGRYAGKTTAAASSAQSSAVLLSTVRWTEPSAPELALSLLLPGGQTAAAPASSLVASSLATDAAPSVAPAPVAFYSVAAPAAGVHIDLSQLPNPKEAREKDEQALQRLRAVFEESAGRVRESLFLLDVSTNVDQLGVAWGFLLRDAGGPAQFPLQIHGLDVVSPGQNSRLFLLPQFQWEPLRNLPNPNIGFYPDRLVSGDDGGATLFGSSSVRLVPVTPDAVLDNLVGEFNDPKEQRGVGAWFTLPFGIAAAAQLAPRRRFAARWAGLHLVRPKTPQLRGGYQISVTAHAQTTGPTIESPSLRGAAWQTRNGVDPISGAPNGFSALRGDLLNEGVEAFFNGELGPGGTNPRVPVTRVDFAGYGASAFSKWFNPNAVAEISQVRFDVFVGRTAYEVVQVASVLYPWAVPVVRTITLERRREGLVCRADSGWVATGHGLYRYPPVNPTATPPAEWSPIETHPGVVRGAFNVRRIRETGRVVERAIGGETIELLEVRFDADMQIEGVVKGQIAGTDLVPSIDQLGFVQRAPKGYPLVPQHLAAILADEGALGGPVNCEIEVAASGQHMHVVRVDVDASEPAPAGVPEFAAAARGSLALPEDGASWSVARRQSAADEFEPVDPIAGTPLIRQGRASAPGTLSPWYRFADPRDLLVESTPSYEFGVLQTSDGHQFLFPRPRIELGSTTISSTERPLLADAYARSTSAGLFPKRTTCFSGPPGSELQIVAGGRYRLGPATTANFDNIAGGEREIIDGDALAIRTRYAGPIRYTLDPGLPQAWSVAIDTLTTSLDLGPFDDLMGVKHDYRMAAGQVARLVNPTPQYAPFLEPVVEIVRFLSDLLGIDEIFEVLAVQGSFKFQATAQYPIEGPGNDYIDFGAMKIKGKLQTGFGWSEKDHWFGFFGVDLGLKVPALPPIFANGKTSISLKGTELTGQEVKIRVIWGVAVEAKLGPLGVSAEFNYGIEVIVSESGKWQIGLLVQVVGKAEILIVKVAVRIELMAAIARLPPPDEKVEAIGQAKFAAEVEICWFLTISVEYDIEYREAIDI
jgi:hypothetical protein